MASGSIIAQTATSGPDASDVQFMQGMIAHHAQALAMVALAGDRTTRPDLQAIGLRIKISQQDEIAFMQRWLRDRHQVVPLVDSAYMAHMPGMQMGSTPMPGMMMPGMMTAQQMARLAQATGVAFDRVFLEGMIRHHEGALSMIKDLMTTQRGAEAPEVFTFASDADAEQRAEIQRMRSILNELGQPGGTP